MIAPQPRLPRFSRLSRVLGLALAVSMCCAAAPALAGGGESENAHYVHKKGTKTLKELVQAELDGAKKKGQVGVILMFTADWCSPCKAIKEFVHGSGVVRKALAKGRLLYIDVDEWRGPAQALIPGVDASKLPTMVRLGFEFQMIQTCFGSEMGLLHEDALAHNFDRLLQGKPIEKPFYADKPDQEREFILKQSEAQTAKTKGVPVLSVTAKGSGDARKVTLTIANHDGPRRWFLVPARLDQPLSEKPNVRAWWKTRWTEHVRADFLRIQGSPEFYAIPVAGYGSVELANLALPGTAKDGKLTVWELDFLKIDGAEQQFQMKLPYELKIAQFDQTTIEGQGGAAKVEMRVRNKYAVVVK